MSKYISLLCFVISLIIGILGFYDTETVNIYGVAGFISLMVCVFVSAVKIIIFLEKRSFISQIKTAVLSLALVFINARLLGILLEQLKDSDSEWYATIGLFSVSVILLMLVVGTRLLANVVVHVIISNWPKKVTRNK